MAQLNANLLQIGGLSNIIGNSRAMRQQEQQNNLAAVGSLINTFGEARDKNAINEAMANNFDPVSGQLNQQGLIADLYNYNPQLAQQMSDQYQSKNLENLKTQSGIDKTLAETSKLSSESKSVELKNQLDQQKMLGQLILGAQDQAGMDKAIQFAKSQGIDTSLFESVPFSPALKSQAMGQLIDANSQIENMIKQEELNIKQDQLGISQQNADATMMNAISNRQKTIDDIENRGALTQYQQAQVNMSREELELEREKASGVKAEKQLKQREETLQKENDIQEKIFTIDSSIDSSNNLLNLLDRLENNESLPNILGTIQGRLPGVTEGQNNAIADIETIKSNMFLQAIQSMKGMGALSDAEGKKLESAITSLNRNQGEQQFYENIQIIRDLTSKGINRLNQQKQNDSKTLNEVKTRNFYIQQGFTPDQIKKFEERARKEGRI